MTIEVRKRDLQYNRWVHDVVVDEIRVGSGSFMECVKLADELRNDSSKAIALRNHWILSSVQNS